MEISEPKKPEADFSPLPLADTKKPEADFSPLPLANFDTEIPQPPTINKPARRPQMAQQPVKRPLPSAPAEPPMQAPPSPPEQDFPMASPPKPSQIPAPLLIRRNRPRKDR